jgi:hypothetical protein
VIKTNKKAKLPKVYFFQLDISLISDTCGIFPGDKLLLVYADEDRKPRDGEIVFMDFHRRGGGCGSIDGGRFRQDEGGGFSITHDGAEGSAVSRERRAYYPRSQVYLMRVIAVERPNGQVKWLVAGDGEKLGSLKPLPLPEFVPSYKLERLEKGSGKSRLDY